MSETERSRFLNNISAETHRADRLLGKLLELSVLEGKSKLEQTEVIDLRILLRRVVDEAEAMADLAGVQVVFTEGQSQAMVVGDPFILMAAATNLMENAIDFSPQGSEVKVSLERDGNSHQMVIQDSGEGIPDYAKEKVFERFFSLRHLRTGRKGTGLGLTLVREAAGLHLGSVALEASAPTGTKAVFTIPAC